ncbi:hypothetical protein Halhy_4947 [Haliscomenobacter hydrossis DSM 1100]|uniref:Uncharacterized protein n=1 Tax=Haliscomenobacter hydrossis (strain ATCC 27775 / DSM 1100 / LMG 10767 / O) TaxID=760192 RepID=F4L066_HALH1|nr:hypothetical protein Halhy_4947 [Haliscomenobacter hydrossis DSM 1100]
MYSELGTQKKKIINGLIINSPQVLYISIKFNK